MAKNAALLKHVRATLCQKVPKYVGACLWSTSLLLLLKFERCFLYRNEALLAGKFHIGSIHIWQELAS